MATNPIYVESEEEIPEVVERLRRFNGEDTMLVLPMRSRIGQSRFNFQLLRNYAARLGKRVTVVCDDPAVQKMASESGFPVFGAVGVLGEGIPSEPEPPPPVRRWWNRRSSSPTTHVGIAAPTRLLTKTATELKPGRFLLYITAATLLLVGLFGAAIYVPSASVTLIAQAAPFTQKDVEIQATPASKNIHVRIDAISKSSSQGFKTTGSIVVPLAPAQGQVIYDNTCAKNNHNSPGIQILRGQRLDNTNGITFAQNANDFILPWGQVSSAVGIIAVQPGSAGNVGSGTITTVENNNFLPDGDQPPGDRGWDRSIHHPSNDRRGLRRWTCAARAGAAPGHRADPCRRGPAGREAERDDHLQRAAIHDGPPAQRQGAVLQRDDDSQRRRRLLQR